VFVIDKNERMSEEQELVTSLFKHNGVQIQSNRSELFERFLQQEDNWQLVQAIIQHQRQLMTKWKLEERISEIKQQPVRILNATVGKPYETKFDFDVFKWKDITDFYFEGLENTGLVYDEKTKQLTGTPTQSGDFKILFKFRVEGQTAESPFNEKTIVLIINPDPKSLWKNIESDKTDPYWKEDNETVFAPLGKHHILASSKRGRSHATVGSFREDHFAFANLEDGWCIIVVSDGAGSAKMSRKGSAIACTGVIDYFSLPNNVEAMKEFDALLQQYNSSDDDDASKKMNAFVYNHLGKAAFTVHKQLEGFAISEKASLKDLGSTLIFTLFKKYDIGYAFLSFGVGDCPIALLNKDITGVTMMNWLDVGEYGGGTRFITMPEIFKSEKFASRFGFKLVEDFSYLVMMSDGIYDPKFVVEANLTNIKKWQEFLADLGGKNEDGVRVELSTGNDQIIQQFDQWMDFWSPGNHDDRTLAIVF
jgi:serine/threonine protein phosphatase PrpC